MPNINKMQLTLFGVAIFAVTAGKPAVSPIYPKTYGNFFTSESQKLFALCLLGKLHQRLSLSHLYINLNYIMHQMPHIISIKSLKDDIRFKLKMSSA